nr:metal homeostasis factor atx1 [Quercus suber]
MAEHHYKFNVKMTCGGCSGAVERVLKKLDGVKTFDVSLESQTADVTTEESVDYATVLEKIKKTGKQVNSGEADEASHCHLIVAVITWLSSIAQHSFWVYLRSWELRMVPKWHERIAIYAFGYIARCYSIPFLLWNCTPKRGVSCEHDGGSRSFANRIPDVGTWLSFSIATACLRGRPGRDRIRVLVQGPRHGIVKRIARTNGTLCATTDELSIRLATCWRCNTIRTSILEDICALSITRSRRRDLRVCFMRKIRPSSFLLAARMAASSPFPYNPTRVLLAPNTSHAYVFQSSAQSAGQSELLTVDISASISASQYNTKTVSSSLPFLQDDVLVAYTPVIDADGNIVVSSGNCSNGADGTQVWHFATGGDGGSGSWSQWQTSNEEQTSQTSLGGANFLSSGVAFSEQIGGHGSNMTTFIFGGMCPWANSTTESWTSSADYSNLMVTLAQDTSEETEYDISLAMNRGPPIAEAGFSITPLPPTYAIDSEGSAQSQQQDFVFLGGHTESAFINMSQVALYSLPQEAWTFLPVTQPSNEGGDQDQASIEPRSGHTAVLSEDGGSVIVFGGWVGDITNAAEPQLAILEIGAGYGGDGSWTWSIPTQASSDLGITTGLYGHGATMLPGGVMMILGGYSIDTTSSQRSKREVSNSKMYLYDTTSNTWIDSYTPPETFSTQFAKSSKPLATKAQKIGLGVGIGIGVILLVILIGLYVWYSRRVKRAREARDRALLSRSSDISFNQADLPFLDRSIAQNENPPSNGNALGRLWNKWDDHENTSDGRYPPVSQMSEQPTAAGATGLFLDIPSPTRGLRRNLTNRPHYQYHAAPRYDDNRLSRAGNNIHPIAELENEDGVESTTAADESEMLSDAERKLRQLELVLSTPTDPFLDEQPKPLGSHPVSPEADGTVRRVPTGASQAPMSIPRKPLPSSDESPNWVAETGPGDYQEQDGRASPTKSDGRTLSTLSDRSQRSILTNSSITRTMSTRTGAILAAALGNRTSFSPEHSSSSSSYGDSRTNTMSTGGRKSPFFLNVRTRSSTNGSILGGPNSAVSVAESFLTAKTNFAQLQSDGEALLGGRPTFDRDDPYQRAMAAQSSTSSACPFPDPRLRYFNVIVLVHTRSKTSRLDGQFTTGPQCRCTR